MTPNSLTEKYLEAINIFSNIKALSLDITRTKSDTLNKIKQKSSTLDNYNSGTANLFHFYEDINFIEDGLNCSWKDNISSNYKQEDYLSLQLRIKK